MIFHETKHGIIYHGDCLEVMQQFEDKSFDFRSDMKSLFAEVGL
jgi:hypothetical protein